MFQHAYDSYLTHASDYDELKPLTLVSNLILPSLFELIHLTIFPTIIVILAFNAGAKVPTHGAAIR